jgi:hypothetical protein
MAVAEMRPRSAISKPFWRAYWRMALVCSRSASGRAADLAEARPRFDPAAGAPGGRDEVGQASRRLVALSSVKSISYSAPSKAKGMVLMSSETVPSSHRRVRRVLSGPWESAPKR